MSQYILRRVLIMIPVLIGITFINFGIVNLAPGDAVDLMIDPNMSEADKEIRRENLGLNDPFLVRYFRWVSELLRGNLGYSFTTYKPVKARVIERLGPTIYLMGTAIVIAYLIAIPLGILSALKPYSWLDYLTSFVGLSGVSIPTFFSGLVVIYIFSLKLGWLPSGGIKSLGAESSFIDSLRHLVMPAAILALANVGLVLRLMRSSTLEILQQDYIRTAWAKGLTQKLVVLHHVMRNSLIPIVTMAGMQVPVLISGAVITEQVFQWPGMGLLTIQAILSRDYPTIMALNLLAAILVLIGTLVADILYVVIDPRIQYQ
ncbi:MAG TPA: ABC transporter permease [Halanaerobiales bacterium]|nr:ABC transporter permease [Halanaerobiales bacterium]